MGKSGNSTISLDKIPRIPKRTSFEPIDLQHSLTLSEGNSPKRCRVNLLSDAMDIQTEILDGKITLSPWPGLWLGLWVEPGLGYGIVGVDGVGSGNQLSACT